MQDATAALEEAKTKQEVQKSRLDAEWATLHLQVSQLEQAKARQQEIGSNLQVRVVAATKGIMPAEVASPPQISLDAPPH